MKAFASDSYQLRQARVEVRLVYTGFLLLVAVGMLTMAAFQLRHIGPTPSGVAAYYRGGERGGEMAFAKTFRELVEVTHFHAFIMGVVYLVLAHLFIATPLRPDIKRWFIVLALAGLAGDLVSPWLIRYVSGALAYVQLASWAGEWLGFAAFIGVPIAEMWFRHGGEQFPPE
jgi:hypothetical protein